MGLDTVEFVMWAEQEFAIEIPDADAANLITVGAFVEYINRHQFVRPGRFLLSPDEIFERTCAALHADFNVSRAKISLESEFVRDLRLDS